eukprot:Hpha_TRINITY_DN5180_c0_g2::TRINITY_DN5180_c0_g2_i1::g.192994::m.192994
MLPRHAPGVATGVDTHPGGLTAKSDGLSASHDAVSGSVVVYGGAVGSKVWVLSLETFRWRELRCSGAVPPARRYHSGTCRGGHLLVFGGELVQASRELHAPSAPYYELDLETAEWRAVHTDGDAPAPRSHHSAVTLGGGMVVCGGKRTDQGRPMRQTCRGVADDATRGFFDIHILNVSG